MARDPSTRPYRIAAMTLFVTLAVGFIYAVVQGLVLSLLHQGALPPKTSTTECREAIDRCGEDLRALRARLEAKSCELQQSGTQAERTWDDWIVSWQHDLNALRGECCLGEGGGGERAPLLRAATDLEQLGRLYTTQLVQYAHEVGPTSERCAADLALIPRVPPAPAPKSSPDHP